MTFLRFASLYQILKKSKIDAYIDSLKKRAKEEWSLITQQILYFQYKLSIHSLIHFMQVTILDEWLLQTFKLQDLYWIFWKAKMWVLVKQRRQVLLICVRHLSVSKRICTLFTHNMPQLLQFFSVISRIKCLILVSFCVRRSVCLKLNPWDLAYMVKIFF